MTTATASPRRNDGFDKAEPQESKTLVTSHVAVINRHGKNDG